MRILFTGASPWTNSGYGKPWRYLLPRLHQAGHDLALAAFYGWGGTIADLDVGGAPLRIYPPAADTYFNDIIDRHVAHFRADVVITLQDVWILDRWGQRDFRWCPWLPVDTSPVSEAVRVALDGCHTPLAYCAWARRELVAAGFLRARTVPFGVDLDLHQPRDPQTCRKRLGLPDGFLAGMVAANSSDPSRKSLPEVLLAWRDWLSGGGEGHLYLHTTLTPKGRAGHGIDLIGLLATLDLPWSTLDDPNPERRARAAILFPAQYRMWAGDVDDAELSDLYNSLDVLLAPSQAEGFGIPIIEAQACGVPVVTLHTTAMPELTWNGVCLNPLQPIWEDQGGWRGIAPVAGIRDAIERAARGGFARGVPEQVRDYDWDVMVARDWLPFLDELEAEA